MPDPAAPEDDQVLVKVSAVGVCGSDVHYYTTGRIGSQVVRYPYTVGHEFSGTVEAAGASVTRVTVGQRIAVDPAMPCGECDQCAAGRHHTCRKLRFLGCPGQADGCLSEYVVMPETSCFPVDDSISDDGAVFSEPLAIGVYAVGFAMDLKGKTAAVLGAGPIGLSVLFAARRRAARAVYVTDPLDYRAAFSVSVGAQWAGSPEKSDVVADILEREPLGVDFVFECCGKQEAVDQALRILKPGGRLMIVGIPQFDRFSFVADTMRRHEICIQNVRRQVGCVEDALSMVADGGVPVERVVTHHFGLEEAKRALDLVADRDDDVIKAVIRL